MSNVKQMLGETSSDLTVDVPIEVGLTAPINPSDPNEMPIGIYLTRGGQLVPLYQPSDWHNAEQKLIAALQRKVGASAESAGNAAASFIAELKRRFPKKFTSSNTL
jgi:hypothetical protein